ncbi:MAG TPA: YciI family protein [Ilumatobacteraceae bacterium]|jgi:hypothetical protein|nr:YciI family protein [Ilumatobacteraceae bacterium]
MPKYLLLIVESEQAYAEAGEAEFNAVMEAHQAFSKEVAELGGAILGGEALQPVPTATFLRGTRTDRVEVVDNPAPDLKEILGGYYLVEAADDEQARAIAERCPAAYGYIEIRPIWEIPDTYAG